MAEIRPTRRQSVTKAMNYKAVLPERFQVDLERRYVMDKLQLGAGGFGKVYIATDSKYENRLVAVKKMTKTTDVKGETPWRAEIEIMKNLDHPNICKLFETFEDGPQLYFIMEYLEGGELFERIINSGYISEGMCAEISGQVVAALRYAHSRSIAHRDIKPENLVFCSKDPDDYRIKLIDWGLGVDFSGELMLSPVGSFTYAAPEVILVQKRKEAYTSACDLWSTGIVAYVMLCGKPPFWGTPKQHLKNAQLAKYPMSAPPWDVISDNAKDFIQKLLKPKAKERMSAEEAAQHPWICKETPQAESKVRLEIMRNLESFNNQSMFVQFCVTAVAKQLDHTQLKDIYSVFREMDVNGDGTLSTEEIAQCYEKLAEAETGPTAISRSQSSQMKAIFGILDLDGSGAVDYTEFCAAALGENFSQKVEAVWAAFNAFDIDYNGRLSKDEVQKLLSNMYVQEAWTAETCALAADKLMAHFDKDGDANISFDEWMEFMNGCWAGSAGTTGLTDLSGMYLVLGQDLTDAPSPSPQV